MNNKRFIVTNDLKLYYDNDGIDNRISSSSIFVADLNLKIGQNVLINLLNNYEVEKNQLTQKIKNKNEYQQVLEAKIRRLKERIRVLENDE